VSFKKTDQAHLMLGVRSFPYGAKTEMAEKLLGVILGGSMGSRLFTELRERRGLAYYVRAQSEFYSDTGYFAAQAGLRVEKVEESIEIILREFKKIVRESVRPAELKRIKDLIKGRMAIQLESSDSIASWYGRQAVLALEKAEALGGAPDYKKEILTPKEFFRQVDKTRAGEIQDLAKEIFKTQNLNLAVIGPYRDERRFAKLLKI
jgi:predicted Zn-dependent peptidase